MKRRFLFHFMMCILAVAVLLPAGSVFAQKTGYVIGLHTNKSNFLAFTNATIVTAPGNIITDGTLIVKDGEIIAVGKKLKVPGGATVTDLKGKYIYPGFIDLFTDFGMPKQSSARPGGRSTGASSAPAEKGSANWNRWITPEKCAADELSYNDKAAEEYRKQGITSVTAFPVRGIFKGSGALVQLNNAGVNDIILDKGFAEAFALDKGREFASGTNGYPSSMMGTIALIRQNFMDALWYHTAQALYHKSPSGQTPPETNVSLGALYDYATGKKPLILSTESEFDILRGAKIAKEFGLDLWILGNGYEYRRLDAVKNTGLKIILPVNFPDKPDVATPEDEYNVTLRELRHWEIAPANPALLAQKNVPFAFTSAGLKKKSDFLKNIRTAVERGLPENEALASLTVNPAGWLKKSDILGTLEKGKIANFIITDGNIFESGNKIISTYVAGQKHTVTEIPDNDLRGTWKLAIGGAAPLKGSVTFSGSPARPKTKMMFDKKDIAMKSTGLENAFVTLSFDAGKLGKKGLARLSGLVSGETITGNGLWGDGTAFTWTAEKDKPFSPKKMKKNNKKGKTHFPELVYPAGAYGRKSMPAQPEYILVKNGTIWTSGPQGKLTGADMLVKKGKIEKIGKNLTAPSGAVIIDASGKHVSPGLIDNHSHIASDGGVNEGTHAITSEARIKDVLDSDDISIYRQLAGGLTSACTLHGSANPIGGQYAVIKLRWGALPDDLIMDVKEGIKFALGENVKQSRSNTARRYPRTRMGVVEIIKDAFQSAKDYRKEWERYEKEKAENPDIIPPRKNLRMEALLEVLDDNMIIHCHGYRHDEMLALMRLGEEMGFKVSVFIHVLEGYKIATEMKKHGAMPTVLSDWWAYKVEAYDAIPYNSALMYHEGLPVAFHSDNAELARRMNLEAAKAVKYGGVPEEDALKFVTLNSAIQICADKRIGSLEEGKDADFVIWSGSPLSTYTRCEQTWIDGMKFFDKDEDARMRQWVQSERTRLIGKILASDEKPAGKRPGRK